MLLVWTTPSGKKAMLGVADQPYGEGSEFARAHDGLIIPT